MPFMNLIDQELETKAFSTKAKPMDEMDIIPPPPTTTKAYIPIEFKTGKEIFNTLKSNQNYRKALISGVLSSISLLALWIIAIHLFQEKLTILSLPIGIIIAFSIRKFGNGITASFGVTSVVITCITIAISLIASEYMLDIISNVKNSYSQIITKDITTLEVIIYGLAIYFSYTLAFRKISENDLKDLK